tara:strand:- start:3886 stop:4713 length:828 start_codon:yes stop_codon:yes gene_type:complete
MNVGLVISDDKIKKYELKELSNLLNSKYRISYIFSEKKIKFKNNKIYKIFNSIVRNKLFYLIYLEQKISSLFNNQNSYSEHLKLLEKKINIFNEFPILNEIPKIEFECSKIDNKFSFHKDMIEVIRKNCDILILLGFNKVLHPKILDITRHGILSFHTANINRYRGRPAAFNEFINNEKYGGLTLQILAEQIDFGKIVEIREVEIENTKSFDETLYKMMCLKEDLIVKGLDKINNNEKFLKPKNKTRISTLAESRKFSKVYSCLKKTINRRYFSK